jgi:hypothetical protein
VPPPAPGQPQVVLLEMKVQYYKDKCGKYKQDIERERAVQEAQRREIEALKI